jgi:undecaprenyl diphosphate synthase
LKHKFLESQSNLKVFLVSSLKSSTQNLPVHVAIIMDGNGRWARARNLSNSDGHRAGLAPLRSVIEYCGEVNIPALTVFAFSSENWQRPDDEVSALMNLFVESLTGEIDDLHEKGVQLRLIGARDKFTPELLKKMDYCEQLTASNSHLVFTIAIDYGGRWDIAQAAKSLAQKVQTGKLDADDINETLLAEHICNSDLPEPDICIRTGGEYRISNFLLWQFAYTEFVVNECLWPEYSREIFEQDLKVFTDRERRFGQSG